jgi:outer membrane receptor for ferrienterochelin and colicins
MIKQAKKTLAPYRKPVLAMLAAGLVVTGPALAEDVETGSVTVTATRSEISLEDAPGAITIISAEDLADMPEGDLMEAVRETPGITMIGRSVGGRKSISIRGMDSRHSLILIDGKRIAASTAIFGHSNFENNWLNSDNIERIEVVRGPLSALYGSEAIGGVINIITKPTSKKAWSFGGKAGGGDTDDDGGGTGYFSAHASGPVIQDKMGVYLAAGYNKEEDTPSEDNEFFSEREGLETFSLNSRLTFTPNSKHTIDLAIDFVNEDRWRDTESRSGPYKGEYDIDKYMYSLAWNGSVGPTRSSVKLYRSEIDKDSIKKPTRGPVSHYPETLTNDVLDAQTTFALGPNLFTLGGELRKENLESTTLASGEDDALHSALFIQDEIELFDSLRITLGGRFDDHEDFGSEFSPRVYALYQATDNLNIKAGYGHAFNAPTIKQVSAGYHADFGPHTFLGNPDVEPETSDNYELGVEYNAKSFWAKAFYFHNDIEDLIDWKTVGMQMVPGGGPPRFTFMADNVAEARTRGVESEIGIHFDWGLSASLNYTWLDAEDRENDTRLPGKPKHTVNAKLGYTLEKFGLSAALRFQFIGNQVLESGRDGELADVPDYSLWHFSARKTLGEHLELKLGVENIGDVRLADKSDLFAYEERGRFFYAALKTSF